LRTDYVLEAQVPILELKHEPHSPQAAIEEEAQEQCIFFWQIFGRWPKKKKRRNLGIFLRLLIAKF
jgi:hypothetical protein